MYGTVAKPKNIHSRFTLVELSDGESDNEEDGSSWGFAGSAEGEFHSNLPAQGVPHTSQQIYIHKCTK